MKKIKKIKLKFCEVLLRPEGHVTTTFLDGAVYSAYPHNTTDYINLATRLGYDDIDTYCHEHEFCHNFIPEELFGKPSRVLWPLAHGGKHGTAEEILAEEAVCILFQGFLRGDQTMAATAPGVNWWDLRDKARLHLG